MVKKNNYSGSDHKPGSSATVLEGDVVIDLDGICDCIAEAIGILKECNSTENKLICEKLEALQLLIETGNATLLDILNALDLLKTCNSEENALICQKLESILEELQENECTIDECCIAPDPENRDRWCQMFNTEFPAGSGDANDTYTIGIGGVYETLPNPYTQADVIAALNAIQPAGQWAFVTNADGETFLCRYDQAGAVTTRSSCCFERRCYLAVATGIQTFVAGDEVDCKLYKRIWTKYEQPIADTLATSLTVQTELLEKFCDVQADCPAITLDADYTSGFRYILGRPQASNPWQFIDNTDPLNQVVVAEAPNLNDFVAQMELLGFSEWSFGEEHFFCPCPSDLIEQGDYFITQNGERSENVLCSPLAELPGAPDKVIPVPLKALRTIGCNDNRRDDLLQSLVDLADQDLLKSCLVNDGINGVCPSELIEPLNKEAQTLTLEGDVIANYTSGTDIALQDANGNICGSATVADSVAVLNEAGNTVIKIVECELQEGKEPLQIKQAKPVLQATATAVKAVVKQVSMLQAKSLTKISLDTKTATKG